MSTSHYTRSVPPRRLSRWDQVVQSLADRLRRRRLSQELQHLTDRDLRDIGAARRPSDQAPSNPFWMV